MALLARRGLDRTQREQARAILNEFRSGELVELPGPSPDSEQEKKAAAVEMWEWYMEWALLVRTAVESKQLRIQMGVSRPNRKQDPDDAHLPCPS